MLIHKTLVALCCIGLIATAGCSRQQSDWQKTREANTTEAYEQFVKKYPSGEFTAQAQTRLKELYEEHDWQKARDADTPEAYQSFLKQYPDGKWTEEARIRVENFTLAQAPGGGGAAGGGSAAPGGAAPAAAPDESPAAPVAPRGARAPASASHPHSKDTPSGKFAVQLGAFRSGREAAHKRWEHLEKQYPALFSGAASKILAKKTNDGTLYRLRAVGLTEAHARKVCEVLRATSQACVLVRPDRVT